MDGLLNYGVIAAVALLMPSFAFAQHSQATSTDAAEPLPAVRPESVGVSSQRLERIGVVLHGEIDRKMLPGAVVAIARKGKLVYYEAFGTANEYRRLLEDAGFDVEQIIPTVAGIDLILSRPRR
jgi:CubicO group peptidase (beta-lactamase class C family)